MKPFIWDPSGWVKKNRDQHGERYGLLNWVSKTTSEIAETQRQHLLSQLHEKIHYGFKDTKIDCRNLSRGCTLCGQGLWSCLFINGLCNCACFYCPNVQDDISLPTTNMLTFQDARHYAEYIKSFGFKGVSISGGEPLMTFERSLAYLTAVKKHAGASVYTWLYTNGTLITEKKLEQLRDAGLDEIRFDIGAADYSLAFVEQAIGIIPTVTIEIPAVPEDKEILKDQLRVISDMGVKHLNLHQLRLTPFNFTNLSQRPYTFLHGEQVTVLESELCALEILLYARETNIPLGINYCSFHYKNSFQHSSARRRAAVLIKKGFEDITEKGFIRHLTIKTTPLRMARLTNHLQNSLINSALWSVADDEKSLHVSINAITPVLSDLMEDQDSCTISYDEAFLREQLSYHLPFIEIDVGKKSFFIERKTLSDLIAINAKGLRYLLEKNSLKKSLNTCPVSKDILYYESIFPGWKPYC